MGQWEVMSKTGDKVECEVPDCTDLAVIVWLPAFESPGGWSGDHHQYDPNLEIAFVCEEHQPEDFKEAR